MTHAYKIWSKNIVPFESYGVLDKKSQKIEFYKLASVVNSSDLVKFLSESAISMHDASSTICTDKMCLKSLRLPSLTENF